MHCQLRLDCGLVGPLRLFWATYQHASADQQTAMHGFSQIPVSRDPGLLFPHNTIWGVSILKPAGSDPPMGPRPAGAWRRACPPIAARRMSSAPEVRPSSATNRSRRAQGGGGVGGGAGLGGVLRFGALWQGRATWVETAASLKGSQREVVSKMGV